MLFFSLLSTPLLDPLLSSTSLPPSTSCPSQTVFHGGQCLSLNANGTCQDTLLVANLTRGGCDTRLPKCAKCSIPNFDSSDSSQDQPQCDKCIPGFILDDGNCVETCPAGKAVSEDGTTCTGDFPDSCIARRTLTSTHRLHQQLRNLRWEPKLLPDLLLWSIRLQRAMCRLLSTNTFSSNASCISCHLRRILPFRIYRRATRVHQPVSQSIDRYRKNKINNK